MASALEVAKSFFDHRKSEDGGTPGFVRIHKLVYFAHGFYLAFYDKPLIEEQLEAWQWGPIFPSLYYALFGHNIPEVMASLTGVKDPQQRAFLESLASGLRSVRTSQLSATAHMPGSPWNEAVTKATESTDTSVDFLRYHLPRIVVIEREVVRQYFKGATERTHGREGSP